jgi:predicted HTH transcriptional regulator
MQVSEDLHTEFKFFLDSIDPVRAFVIKKAVTAFLNAEGGTLYIGITDSKEIVGFSLGFYEPGTLVDLLREIIESIDPKPRFDVDFSIELVPIVDP